jgi:hypothetical protein
MLPSAPVGSRARQSGSMAGVPSSVCPGKRHRAESRSPTKQYEPRGSTTDLGLLPGRSVETLQEIPIGEPRRESGVRGWRLQSCNIVADTVSPTLQLPHSAMQASHTTAAEPRFQSWLDFGLGSSQVVSKRTVSEQDQPMPAMLLRQWGSNWGSTSRPCRKSNGTG